MATGLGSIHAALRAEGGGILSGPFPVIVFAELAAAGGDGDLHLRLDPADEGSVPAQMVRRCADRDRGPPGVSELAGTHGKRGIQRESDSTADLFAAGNRAGRDAPLLLVPFLSSRFSQEFSGVPDARVFAGAVGRADGGGAAPSTFPRYRWPVGRVPGSDSADAAGHRDGDGAV